MKIQSYSKQELARAYAPNLSISAALNRLAQWIRNNTELMGHLLRSGYHIRQKVFTSYQVRLIFEYLGEP